jgi:hypothetical protein
LGASLIAETRRADGRDLPDPRVLLRGVDAARSAVGTGELEWQVTRLELAQPKATGGPARVAAIFGASGRRFDQWMKVLVIDGSDPEKASIARKKLIAMGNDWVAFAEAGLGTLKDVHVRSAFDGSKLLHYDGEGGANLSDLAQAVPDYCFEPRILGITATYLATETVPECLGMDAAKSIENLGQDSIDGRSTWHVRVVSKWDSRLDFWIDESADFRVRKFERLDDFGAIYQHWITRSTYLNDDKGTLPSRCETIRYDKANQPIRTVRFDQTGAKYGLVVDAKNWTLAGLSLPPGAPVNDLRAHRRAGYWDGAGVTADYTQARVKANETRWSPMRWGMIVTGVIIAAVALAAVVQRKGLLKKG